MKIEPLYNPSLILRNGHINTLYTYFFRKLENLPFQRERINTFDDDFLDLDWIRTGSKKLIILSHGLEGSSSGKYIRGMIQYFSQRGFDALAWNYRGCSGEINRKLQYYHSGLSNDLKSVINHAINKAQYDSIYLIGFSMGGNITLKYLGEEGISTPSEIKGAVAFSTPVALKSCSLKLSRGISKIYTQQFLSTLKEKVLLKRDLLHQAGISLNDLSKVKNLLDFDDYFTAPTNGFRDGDDYYEKSSALSFLKDISTPTLIVNSLDDPFLPKDCYPFEICQSNKFLNLKTPRFGGHVGFSSLSTKSSLWSEKVAYQFISSNLEV